jgi:broad specificity phosphatase PhoE
LEIFIEKCYEKTMTLLQQRITLIRHGATEWARNGRHTSFTDLPLIPEGIDEAEKLKERLQHEQFDHVFCSPMQRAVRTCEIVGLMDRAIIDKDCVEWQYGTYEGLTYQEIMKQNPHWNLFLQGAPGGESVEKATHRIERVIKRLQSLSGEIALFAHAHFLRLLAVRWIDLAPSCGRCFLLSTASISQLSTDRNIRVMRFWNDTSHLYKKYC